VPAARVTITSHHYCSTVGTTITVVVLSYVGTTWTSRNTESTGPPNMVMSLSCDCPSRQYYSILHVILKLLCNLGPNCNSNTNSNVQPSKGQSCDSFKVEGRHSNKSDETSENGSCMSLKKSSYKEQNHEASKAKGDCSSKSDETSRNGGLNVKVHTKKNAEKKVKKTVQMRIPLNRRMIQIWMFPRVNHLQSCYHKT
jgi:hypothetical protein